jgi:transcriptional regulator with GAF, ATPase, and Fis domain
MVEAGNFREDLWFRLAVFPIHVPPLRDRKTDIPALVQHFLERKAVELKFGEAPRLAPGAMDDLIGYGWPGNVRELENVVERAMILHRGEALRFQDLGKPFAPEVLGASMADEAPPLDLDAVVEAHIRKVLGKTGGKIHGPGGAGELLGVNPNTLRYRMRKLGIPFRKNRESG